MWLFDTLLWVWVGWLIFNNFFNRYHRCCCFCWQKTLVVGKNFEESYGCGLGGLGNLDGSGNNDIAQNIGNGAMGSSVFVFAAREMMELEPVTNNNDNNNNNNNGNNDFDGDSVCHTDVGQNFPSTLALGCMCFLFLLCIYIFFEKKYIFLTPLHTEFNNNENNKDI